MLLQQISISDAVVSMPQAVGSLTVTLSNELVHLLSEQLYQSPQKPSKKWL